MPGNIRDAGPRTIDEADQPSRKTMLRALRKMLDTSSTRSPSCQKQRTRADIFIVPRQTPYDSPRYV
jgi:hypothetical protein